VEETGGDSAGTVVEVAQCAARPLEAFTLLHSAVVVRGASTGKLSKRSPAACFRLQAGGGGGGA
jgi:hypothetical protein